MPSPFPGMDPYLENPALWPGIHHNLLSYIVEDLQPKLLPRYVAAVEERVFLEPAHSERIPDVWLVARSRAEAAVPAGRGAAAAVADAPPEPEWIAADPDLEVHEGYVEIRDLAGSDLVTVVEVLSPTNKTPGPGRDAYVAKQQQVLRSTTNLVEVDLLRKGLPTIAAPQPEIARRGRADYVICTRRSDRPGGFEVIRLTIRDPLPLVAIPLKAGDADVLLDLPGVFGRCYETGAYAYRIDYGGPPVPALSPEDAVWADERIRAR